MKSLWFKFYYFLPRFFPTISLLMIACSEEKPPVKMEFYLPAPVEEAAQWIEVSYIDDGLTSKEVHTISSKADTYLN